MFQAQNRETINTTRKVAVFFKIIMTTSVTDVISLFTTYQTCKTKTKTDFFRLSPVLFFVCDVLRHAAHSGFYENALYKFTFTYLLTYLS